MRISDGTSYVCSSDLPWTFIALIILSGLAILVTMTRAGIDLLWTPVHRPQSHLSIIEAVPIGILLAVCLALMIQAGPIMNYMRSEEHTSELQSLMRTSYAVFCLKKKK